MRSPLAALFAASLLGTGCFGDQRPVDPAPPSPANPTSSPSSALAPAIPQVMEAPASNTAPRPRAGAADSHQGVNSRDMERVFEEAMAVEGEGDCDTAFRGVLTMAEGMQRLQPERSAAAMPERGEFMEICASLPEPIRRCLAFSYQRTHADECRLAFRNLEAGQREALRRISWGP